MRFKLESTLGDGWSVDEVCKKCGENSSECTCNREIAILEPSKHQLVFRYEKRKGKPVTIVGEFSLPEEDIKALAKKLKVQLSTGGTAKERWIELQGDCKDKTRILLERDGYKFKR